MIMKNISKTLLIIIAVCGFISCNNDFNENLSDTKNKELAKNYLDFFRAKSAEGSVLIQSSTSTAMQNINRNITLSEKKLRNNDNRNNLSKSIEIKGFSNTNNSMTMKNSDKDYNNFFGKVLSYRVVDNSNSSRNSTESNAYNDVYIPELIDVSYSTEKLIPGTTISWNVDDLNANGVIVSVEYYAINQLDRKLAFDNPTTIKRSFVLDDLMGSYTISESDLEIFPNKALLDINVLRAGFDTDENSNLSIAGLTKVGDTKMAQR